MNCYVIIDDEYVKFVKVVVDNCVVMVKVELIVSDIVFFIFNMICGVQL